jgi:hypothetical protein
MLNTPCATIAFIRPKSIATTINDICEHSPVYLRLLIEQVPFIDRRSIGEEEDRLRTVRLMKSKVDSQKLIVRSPI